MLTDRSVRIGVLVGNYLHVNNGRPDSDSDSPSRSIVGKSSSNSPMISSADSIATLGELLGIPWASDNRIENHLERFDADFDGNRCLALDSTPVECVFDGREFHGNRRRSDRRSC